MSKLIAQIKRKDDYAFFLKPVDVANVPGYADLVKHPMDFGTMTDKVNRAKYRSLEDFASDLRLVTTNAKIFNPPGTIYHTEAERIEAWGLEHIAKASLTVIQYETDWNIEIEKDDEVNIDDEEDDGFAATPMDMDDQNMRRSASVASQPQPGPGRRGPRGPYRRQPNTNLTTFSESLDADGHLPGSKDGIGAFPPGSGLAKTMIALKLKGKRYRTKRERQRFERDGPPLHPDGSVNYTQMEDPFSILSVLVRDLPSRPQLTPLYPPVNPVTQVPNSISAPQPQPPLNYVGATSVTPDYQLPALPVHPVGPQDGKRRHWLITRNATGRQKGKEREDDPEAILDIPWWQVPRDAHATDMGSFASLAGGLADEMVRRGLPVHDHEEMTLDLIRDDLDCESLAKTLEQKEVASGLGFPVSGYWTIQRASEAEEYIRDIVYGGVDGLAYARSLAEFVAGSKPQEEVLSVADGGLGMPLAKWVEHNVIDALTEGHHDLIRETALLLRDRANIGDTLTNSTHKMIAKQINVSLDIYPKAMIALSALLQIQLHKIDMGALIKTPEELFLSEAEWVGKDIKERRAKAGILHPDAQDAMEVEEPERTWVGLDASMANGQPDGASDDYELEGPEELNEVLDYVAGVILELNQRLVKADIKSRKVKSSAAVKKESVDTLNCDTESKQDATEDPVLRNLRLNLLALAKRAPLDTIACLPKDLVPEHIRQFVPTLATSS